MGLPDLITMGRSGVDLYPLQINRALADVESFGKFLGGSPTNVAVACARLASDNAAVITGVGDDPFGRWVRQEMRRLGVDDSYVTVTPEFLTPITFCEIFPPDNFPLYFYRRPSAPDLNITGESLPLADLAATKVFWFSGTGLCQEPSLSAHLTALEARGRSAHTVFDLDWRPMFWTDPVAAEERYAACLEFATVAVGNREECETAVGETDPDRAADALLERGVSLAIVKQGHLGTLAKTATERVVVPPTHCATLNGLGAGDAFGGSLAYGLIHNQPVEVMIRRASAAGAIVASRLECSTAMPTGEEIDQVLAAETTDVLASDGRRHSFRSAIQQGV